LPGKFVKPRKEIVTALAIGARGTVATSRKIRRAAMNKAAATICHFLRVLIHKQATGVETHYLLPATGERPLCPALREARIAARNLPTGYLFLPPRVLCGIPTGPPSSEW